MGSFFTELKRRNVFKVEVAYALVAWLLIQIVATVFPLLEFPAWTAQFVTVVILLGFPLAFLAWARELTPVRIQASNEVELAASLAGSMASRVSRPAARSRRQGPGEKYRIRGFLEVLRLSGLVPTRRKR